MPCYVACSYVAFWFVPVHVEINGQVGERERERRRETRREGQRETGRVGESDRAKHFGFVSWSRYSDSCYWLHVIEAYLGSRLSFGPDQMGRQEHVKARQNPL